MTKEERSKRVEIVVFLYIVVSALTYLILSGKVFEFSSVFAIGIAIFNLLIGCQAIIIIISLVSIRLNGDTMDKYVLGALKKSYRDESN
jgi:hypothetical protein